MQYTTRLFFSLCAVFVACGSVENADSTHGDAIAHPEWSRNVSIYEVNLRQYSESGSFAEFEKHLPRLQEMGVGILWFMPVHPIGVQNRKGSLGSYYSVKDYFGINPEHGTMEDFRRLVKKVHAMGMYVLLDWVANHTACDNPLTMAHPEWFTQNEQGEFVPPVPDWSDVIDLDYSKRGLRDYQIKALKYWVEEADIDGYRCDVAGMVPLDFWKEARTELDKIKPVFMLAEWEGPELHENGFDMSYSWVAFKSMNKIAAGKMNATSLDSLLTVEAGSYPVDAYRMRFTSNHDENSWNGTVRERLGDGAAAFAVLAGTIPGMPLVYSGQEAGLDKRLAFFERDVIPWQEHKMGRLYQTLLNLKKDNQALWNGSHGGTMKRINTASANSVFAFIRHKAEDTVLVVLNLSDKTQTVTMQNTGFANQIFTDVFSGKPINITANMTFKLDSWGYKVLSKKGSKN